MIKFLQKPSVANMLWDQLVCYFTSMFIQAWPKSRYYKERNIQSKKRKAIRWWFVSIRHGRHVLSQCPKQRPFPPVLVSFLNISGGWMPLFRALAKNMAPMTNADESPTNRLTLFPIYLSLFIVSTLWHGWQRVETKTVFSVLLMFLYSIRQLER